LVQTSVRFECERYRERNGSSGRRVYDALAQQQCAVGATTEPVFLARSLMIEPAVTRPTIHQRIRVNFFYVASNLHDANGQIEGKRCFQATALNGRDAT
jgi:hypothetical protein